MKKRSILRIKDLRIAKGQHIADLYPMVGKLVEPKTDEPPVSDLAKPGFYFLMDPVTESCVARFFVGRQRSKSGFRAVVSHIKTCRSQVGATISVYSKKYNIIFVSLDKMKALTTGYGKGKWALKFTKQHSGNFQNLSEINRMLNDNFKFYAQGY